MKRIDIMVPSLIIIVAFMTSVSAWSLGTFPSASMMHAAKIDSSNRREFLASGLAASSILLQTDPAGAATGPGTAGASITENGLAAKLRSRDPSQLKNSIFNIPPGVQKYPQFMHGTWEVSSSFGGFLFPSTKIPKQQLFSKAEIPGFQKCSIVAFCDIGKEGNTKYNMRIDDQNGYEDRKYTLTNTVNSYLGYNAIADVIYNPPNRLSIDFVQYKTKNAERVELFCNARESEFYDNDDEEIFVCSEYMRQVTFGGGTEVGIPRQVVGNYAHFWTWRQKKNSPSTITGNVLTAAYLDPQDPLYFQEPSKPVVVYSHVLSASKV